jgi:hypothetical protein
VIPRMPRSPSLRNNGKLNFSARLNSSACGSTSVSAKFRSIERSCACSSVGVKMLGTVENEKKAETGRKSNAGDVHNDLAMPRNATETPVQI